MSESSRFGRFVQQLRQREVPRVLLVYLGAAWVIIEVADLVFPRLGFPDWMVTAVIGSAALGAPLAIAFAWMYDLTATGVRRTVSGEVGDEAAPWLSARSVIAAGLLVAAGVAIGFVARPRPTGSSPTGIAGSAIAVLPFANLSANPDSTLHLSDGFHRELVMQMNRIGLEARSRASVMRFRGTDESLESIARALRVRYVIDGSVTFSGDVARIVTGLVDVAADLSLWDESYDLELTAADIFETQSAIARRVAGELRRELSVEAIARLDEHPTGSLEAWELVQLGVHLWQSRGDSAGLVASRDAFRRAIEIDSMYADPHVGVVLTTSLLGQGYIPFEDEVDQLRAAGLRALALDPAARLDAGPSIQSLLAFHQFLADWDFEDARAELDLLLATGQDPGPFFFLLSGLGEHDRAIDLQSGRIEAVPGAPFFVIYRGEVEYQARRFADALTDAREASRLARAAAPEARLAPREAQARLLAGQALVQLGRIDEGLAELRALVDDGVPGARAEVVWALGYAGRDEEALAEYAVLQAAIDDGVRIGTMSEVRALIGVGDLDLAIARLERAAANHNAVTISLGQHPDFDPLRDRPRFTALLDRVGVPESARYRP